jgi:hypothetical protein
MRERFAHRIKDVHGHRGDMRGKHRGGHWDGARERRQGSSEGRSRRRVEPSGQI